MSRMMFWLLVLWVWGGLVPTGWASSLAPLALEEMWGEAEAVCVGRVVGGRCGVVAGGLIRTRLLVEVDEVLKGRMGEKVVVTIRGGCVGGEGEDAGDRPVVKLGEARLLFLRRSAMGLTLARGADSIRPVGGAGGGSRLLAARDLARVREWRRGNPGVGSDVSAETDWPAVDGQDVSFSGGGGGTGGLSVDGTGLPARWLAADRGEPIPYVVDDEALPLGISPAQALAAIEQALNAWTAVSSVTFRYEGRQHFGQSAATVGTNDGRLRIQLHDLYGQLSSGTVLGLGGRGFTNGESVFASTGGAGGQVAGQEFHRVTRGYVVLQHSSASMRTLSTFTEVLCHEIGHVLGLTHSSENPNESDQQLRDAVMFYLAHADGRGAALGAYDPPVVQKVHPTGNTPPFSFPRPMYLITAPTTPTLAGVNQVTLLGCDRQLSETELTVVAGPASAGNPSAIGAWSRNGRVVTFTPNAFYGDQMLDPAGNSFFARAFYRFSDGVHCSPWLAVRVLGFQTDTWPVAGSDGMPDDWMNDHFGSPNPAAGPGRGAAQDFDGDGLSNLEEFRLGTLPNDFDSALRLTFSGGQDLVWSAMPYELYVIESTVDGSLWERFRVPVQPTGVQGVVSGVINPAVDRRLFRLRRQE